MASGGENQAALPRVGMLAVVRKRRGVVSEVQAFDGADGRFHLVRVEYKNDHRPPTETPQEPAQDAQDAQDAPGSTRTGELDALFLPLRAKASTKQAEAFKMKVGGPDRLRNHGRYER